MHQKIQNSVITERVKAIKTIMPHCAIGVDVIVGFPSESPEDFQETFDYLHALDISYLHVFTYSEGTIQKALEITQLFR